MLISRLPVILVLITAAILAAGCASDPTEGYSSASIYPEDVSTIAVPIFENSTFVRDIEFELTDAVIKEILKRTPYRIASQKRADSALIGTISNVQMTQLSKSPRTGLSEELVVSMTIDFRWEDLRTGRVMMERREFSGHGLFVPSTPIQEPIELGQFAAVQQLARDIVDEMQREW